jgi:hypothetical protein
MRDEVTPFNFHEHPTNCRRCPQVSFHEFRKPKDDGSEALRAELLREAEASGNDPRQVKGEEKR